MEITHLFFPFYFTRVTFMYHIYPSIIPSWLCWYKKKLGERFHIILAYILILRVKGHERKQLTYRRGKVRTTGVTMSIGAPQLPAVLWVMDVVSSITHLLYLY